MHRTIPICVSFFFYLVHNSTTFISLSYSRFLGSMRQPPLVHHIILFFGRHLKNKFEIHSPKSSVAIWSIQSLSFLWHRKSKGISIVHFAYGVTSISNVSDRRWIHRVAWHRSTAMKRITSAFFHAKLRMIVVAVVSRDDHNLFTFW